ncbi:MAG: HD-GYP domain-containing protein [Actinobacteria bacterium]|nr:HD-GYP domain-containing protein [Actinomycetota bacterium]
MSLHFIGTPVRRDLMDEQEFTSRNARIRGHTWRVGDLSALIAERLALPHIYVEQIRMAAPLHDIGKLVIPDAILGKPGRLTADEFELMKTHTTAGARMLAASAFGPLALAEQIARTHHERWDGSGYPAGLVRDEIPMAGRIVATADVFDALTHTRPYKAAWTPAEALAEMTGSASAQFSPQVLDVLSELVRPLYAAVAVRDRAGRCPETSAEHAGASSALALHQPADARTVATSIREKPTPARRERVARGPDRRLEPVRFTSCHDVA